MNAQVKPPLIEITSEQAEQFRLVGVKVRYAIFPSDLVAIHQAPSPTLPPAPAIEPTFAPSPVRALTEDRHKAPYEQQFPRNRLVMLCANPETYVKRYDGVIRQYAEAALMILKDLPPGQPIRKGDLTKRIEKLMGKSAGSCSSGVFRLCVDGFLQVVEPRAPRNL